MVVVWYTKRIREGKGLFLQLFRDKTIKLHIIIGIEQSLCTISRSTYGPGIYQAYTHAHLVGRSTPSAPNDENNNHHQQEAKEYKKENPVWGEPVLNIFPSLVPGQDSGHGSGFLEGGPVT